MTAAQEPGFMGRPSTPDQQPVAQPSAPKPDYHWAYSLPATIMDQYHWKGTEADLHYGLVEPTPGQIIEIARSPDRQIKDVAVGFIRALGVADADGRAVVEPDADGNLVPVLQPVGYREVEAWLQKIGAKGMQMVVGEFQRLFQPSTDEGNAHRASRRRR